MVEGKRGRVTRLARWSAFTIVGAFVVIACRPDAATPEPTPERTLAPSTEAPAESPMAVEPIASEVPMEDGLVTGSIVLPEGSTLRFSADVSVEIQDVSLQDVAATTIGQAAVIVTDPMATELPFEVEYDPADIDGRNTYALRVRIENEAGELLFINDEHTPVITNGAPITDVAVEVVDVVAQAAAAEVLATELEAEESPAA